MRPATRRVSPSSAHSSKLPLPPELGGVPTGAVRTVRLAVLMALELFAPVQVSTYEGVPAALGVTVALPPVACAPLHPPLAVQAFAFVEDQVSVALCPTVIEVGLTESVTVGAATTVRTAVALALPPAPVQASM